MKPYFSLVILYLIATFSAAPGMMLSNAGAAICTAPDSGSGTVALPAPCPYVTTGGPMLITDGLPPGTTLELTAEFHNFNCTGPAGCSWAFPPGTCEIPGGTLSGDAQCFEGTLHFEVNGTGSLAGYYRSIDVPVFCEIHTAPRNPGDPVQAFNSEIYRFQGELFGDPDFCQFVIIMGMDYGLPCPGQYTLTQISGGNFNVDSFFDITYQLQFIGCPGSPLDGYTGVTTGTNHWQQGETYATPSPAPTSTPLPGQCIAPDNGSGTVDLPVQCAFTAPGGPMLILDGLPPGTTIELDPEFDSFFCNSPVACSVSMPPGVCETSGGSLGGDLHCFEGILHFNVTGTGTLAGYSRMLSVPVFCEIVTEQKPIWNPIQGIYAEIVNFSGQLFGDPDFCQFYLTAGTAYGLYCPGGFHLESLPGGNWDVFSAFEFSYRIQFAGCPGSLLDGYSGTTAAQTEIHQGILPAAPSPTPTAYPPPNIPANSTWSLILAISLISMVILTSAVTRKGT